MHEHVTAYSTRFDWEYGPNAALQPFRTKTSRLSIQKTTTYGLIAVIRAFIRTKWRFSDILHTYPHLVGHSHPVSVEVRELERE